MHKRMMAAAICMMAFAMSALAQNVTGASVATTWSSYVNTNISANGQAILSVSVGGNNSFWNGMFAVQGTSSYTPNATFSNAQLLSWSGYNASMNDVQALIMSNTATNTWGDPFIVIQVNGGSGAGNSATLTISALGSNANKINLSSSTSAPYAYTMATSANTNELASGTNSITQLNGSVGIGTTSPGAMLEVAGNVKLTSGSGASVTFADGTSQTTAWTGVLCGGDYAESVDVSGKRSNYGPGDVLVIDPDTPGKFLKSAEPYSTAVLGIYSTRPGALGRRQTSPKGADEVPMAMIGIVPTKVSSENGAIKPGDLLVTSSTPGYAMKGTDRSRMLGAIIGKAMGHLDSGTGMIEVGVALQ